MAWGCQADAASDTSCDLSNKFHSTLTPNNFFVGAPGIVISWRFFCSQTWDKYTVCTGCMHRWNFYFWEFLWIFTDIGADTVQILPLTAPTEYVILDSPNDQACPECVYMYIFNSVCILQERIFVIVIR